MTDTHKGDDAGLIELKPCPFCGGRGEFTPHSELAGMIIAGCENGDCPGHVVAYDFVSRETAANFWNRRPTDDASLVKDHSPGLGNMVGGVGQGEAVAWRFRSPEYGGTLRPWVYEESEPKFHPSRGYKVEPLFASPAAGGGWKPEREAVARLIFFIHGDGLPADSAMHTSNDEHWNFWKNDPPHEDAWKAADAILALPAAPSLGEA